MRLDYILADSGLDRDGWIMTSQGMGLTVVASDIKTPTEVGIFRQALSKSFSVVSRVKSAMIEQHGLLKELDIYR